MTDKPYKLVLPAGTAGAALRRLLVGTDLCAFGPIRRNPHVAAIELLVDDLQTQDSYPQGAKLEPLGDYAVLLAGSANPKAPSIEACIERFAPAPGQLLAVAHLGLGPDRSGWQGVVINAGTARPLADVQIVGPRMVNAGPDGPPNEPQTSADAERYSRFTGVVGPLVANKVRNAHVAIIGASGNGAPMAGQLAAIGVRQIALIDPDQMELGNLPTNRMVPESDLGRPKVEALAERLLAYRSDLTLTVLDASATDRRVVELVRSVDLVVTCVDDDVARLAAAHLARRFLKVHLDVGTGARLQPDGSRLLAGDVRLLLPTQGCVSCVGGMREEATARYHLLAPAGSLRRGRRRHWHEQRLGSLIALNEMTVSVAVMLWLDLLSGRLETSFWQRLRWVEGAGIEAAGAAVDARPDCPICRPRHRAAA